MGQLWFLSHEHGVFLTPGVFSFKMEVFERATSKLTASSSTNSIRMPELLAVVSLRYWHHALRWHEYDELQCLVRCCWRDWRAFPKGDGVSLWEDLEKLFAGLSGVLDSWDEGRKPINFVVPSWFMSFFLKPNLDPSSWTPIFCLMRLSSSLIKLFEHPHYF